MFKGCVLGKHAKTTFPNSESMSKGELDLVHSHICSPISVESISGCSYLMTIPVRDGFTS